MIKPGMIGFSGNNHLFGRLIKFFTKSHFSHAFITTEGPGGAVAVQEATTLCQIVPFDRNYRGDPGESWVVYEITEGFLSESRKQTALNYCFQAYSGEDYGYFQLLFFVWRWFVRKFVRDTTGLQNPFKSGIICSGLQYDYLIQAGLGDLLVSYRSDTITAQDLYEIVQSRPDVFRVVEQSQK